MESQKPNSRNSLYPQIIQSNPDSDSDSYSYSSPYTPSAPSLYPSLDDLNNDDDLIQSYNPNILTSSSEQTLITIPNTIIHLIDKHHSLHLASGQLEIIKLIQNDTQVAVLARIADVIQWPLAKDEPIIKLDHNHYFFSLRLPSDSIREDPDPGQDPIRDHDPDNVLNYGVTIPGYGLEEFDRVLGEYGGFEVKGVSRGVVVGEVKAEEEVKAEAYWTTLAPNVEEYSGRVARMIAGGSGQVIRGILWCGDVTVDRLKWGNEFLKKTKSGGKTEVSPQALKRMKRAKRLTKMSEGVASGILSGVVKVSGLVTGSIVNSKPGKKFFNLLPGEMILASLDGFNRVCDAVEVAGRNVMSTTSTVTTDFVSHRHGEEAAKVTSEGMDAAGHAIGAAWAVFKIRKALNPKSAIKSTTLVKAAASHSKKSFKSKT